jgi:putative membrane protein
MSASGRALTGALAAAYALFWAGGLVSYTVLGEPPAGSRWAAPVFLFLAAGLALVAAPARARPALIAGGLWGLAAEAAGLRLGVPFGHYAYTRALGPAVLGVPWAIGCAWLVLLGYVSDRMARTGLTGRVRAPVAAGWMVALDLLIDPAAAGPLGFWQWRDPGAYYGIPALNFAGWFLVSLVYFLIFPCRAGTRRWAGWPGLSLVVFFTVIAFARGLPLAGLAGILLTALHFAADTFPAPGLRRS